MQQLEPSFDHGGRARLVLEELLALRSARGKLTSQKLAGFPVLVDVLGSGDLLDAFMSLRRELRRYIETANRPEAAAALSISAPAELIGERFEYCANRLSDDPRDPSEPRTARGWSDAGMPLIADDLIYLAEVRGRLGAEMLSIAVHANEAGAVLLSVEQLLQGDVRALAPELTLWRMDSQGDPEQLSVNLGDLAAREARSADHVMRTQHFHLSSELLAAVTERRGLSVAVTGRDAPMRTVSFSPPTNTFDGLTVTFSAYRTRAVVEFTRNYTAPE